LTKRKEQKNSKLGDLVLKWDDPKQDKGKHGKFESLWIGPFNICEVFSNNSYKLQILEDSEVLGKPVNGNFLKKYFI
jgi:hypothetical protein